MAATTLRVDDHIGMHNLNLRAMFIQEGDFDRPWMPAITFGSHFKWNESTSELNSDLGGLLNTLGADHNYGVEFTLVASKTFTEHLAHPIIISAGVRNGDGIHTGLLGFAGQRRTTFEGNVIVFLTDKLAFAGEYRHKSDLLTEFTTGGYHLIKAENDWWSLFLAYVINDNMTISGGYANLGNLANTQEGCAWGIQLKYEF